MEKLLPLTYLTTTLFLFAVFSQAKAENQDLFPEDVLITAEEEGLILKTESSVSLEKRLAWWKSARFGMFVHWGLYSSAEGKWGDKTYSTGAEWVQKRSEVPADEYERVMVPKFKPKKGFAEEWAKLAKEAGAKYVVFTNKHHEGFALHDSKETTFDAKDVTGRDLHREIVDAIRGEGLKVGVYHSLWDWHHPHAYAGPGVFNIKGTSMEGRNSEIYINYLYNQINEITDGRYGAVDILWFDYSSPQAEGEKWGAKNLVTMLKKNQPGILINNRLWSKAHTKKRPDPRYYWSGDFSTPEQKIPATGLKHIAWETCDTLNVTWGWSKYAPNYKTEEDLIRRLIETVSKGGNYLLNIGPMPDGSVDPRGKKLFAAIGEWMSFNSESIYGTTANPFESTPWGRATSKVLPDGKHCIYLHVFTWPEDGVLSVEGLKTKPLSVSLLQPEGEVELSGKVEASSGGVTLSGLPNKEVHSAATVVKLLFEGKPIVE